MNSLRIIPILTFVAAIFFLGESSLAGHKQPQKNRVAAQAQQKTVSSQRKPVAAKTAQRAPASKSNRSKRGPSTLDSQKSLEIRGQARNLSMMLVLKNRQDDINFVTPRNSFTKEVGDTNF